MISRIKRKMVLWIINHFLSGTHAFSIKRRLLNSVRGIEIGEGTKIVGPIFLFGDISVGENTWVGHDFSVEGNGHVSIGNNCDIAPDVAFLTGSHMVGPHEKRAGQGLTGNILVGNGCWIGCGCKVILNIEIGDGVVAAAGTVITKTIKSDCLVGGVPATVIRDLK